MCAISRRLPSAAEALATQAYPSGERRLRSADFFAPSC
jgi:hypothetical protein